MGRKGWAACKSGWGTGRNGWAVGKSVGASKRRRTPARTDGADGEEPYDRTTQWVRGIDGGSGNDLLKGLIKVGAIDILIVLYKFQIGVTCQVVSFEQDKAFAFEGKGVFVELIEKEDTICDLDGEFRVFREVMMTKVAETAVDDGVGDIGFYVIEPVVVRL